MSDDAPGFFSRWSQRKAGKQPGPADAANAPAVPAERAVGTPLQAPVAAVLPADTTPAVFVPSAQVGLRSSEPTAVPAAEAPTAPLPTLDDVAKLRADSDFSPFMGRGIAPAVKNAAMKKLFADPHFNVMDGLDIYIDDYSIPSPLSEQDLKKMVAAQFIKLVEEEPPPVSQMPEPVPGATAVVAHTGAPVPAPEPMPVPMPGAASASVAAPELPAAVSVAESTPAPDTVGHPLLPSSPKP